MQKSTKIIIGVVTVLGVAMLGLGVANAVSVAQTGHPLGMPGNGNYGNMMNGGYGNGTNGNSSTMMNGGYGMMGNRNFAALDAIAPVVTNQVALTNQDAFSPQVIQVRAGTTVTWTNTDTDNHTVTFMSGMMGGSYGMMGGGSSGMMGSTILSSNQSVSYTFNTPGTYNYFCMYHQGMIARVIVTG